MGFRCVRKLPKPQAAADKKPTGFVTADIYLEHKTGPGFPERPARLEAIVKRLKEKGLLAQLTSIEAKPSPLEPITAVHRAEYVERVKKACEGLGDKVDHLDTGDMPISAKSYERR
jgi:acetoin utilization deacetylase AcuC-like enzyme